MASGSAIRAGRAFVELYSDNSKLNAGLGKAERRLRQTAATIKATGKGMFTTGMALAAPIAGMATVFARFDSRMAEVRAITNATQSDFQELRNTAKELGSTTSFSASQAAEGMKFLGMAGFNTKQIIAGLPAVLNLAKAGALELGEAADIASDVGSAFGIAADDIDRIADVMAVTATSANTSISMMGETFKYVASVAPGYNQSLEETSTAIGILGNNGIKASMAGTDLALILKTIGGAGRKQLEEMGIAIDDGTGKMRSLSDIMADLNVKLSDKTPIDRTSLLSAMFGRAAKSALILTGQGKSFDDLKDKIDNSAGAAQRMADIMADSLGGSAVQLWSALEGAIIEFGEALTVTLRPVIEWMTELARSAGEVIKEYRHFVTTGVTVVAGLIAIGTVTVAAGVAMNVAAKAAATYRIALTAFNGVVGLASKAIAHYTLMTNVFSRAQILAFGAGAVARVTAYGAVLALIGVGAYKLYQSNKWIKLFNDEVERGKKLAQEMADILDSSVDDTLAEAASISDPQEKRNFLQEGLERAKKDRMGNESGLLMAQKEFTRQDTDTNFYTGNKVREKAQLDVEEARRLLDNAKAREKKIQDALDELNKEQGEQLDENLAGANQKNSDTAEADAKQKEKEKQLQLQKDLEDQIIASELERLQNQKREIEQQKELNDLKLQQSEVKDEKTGSVTRDPELEKASQDLSNSLEFINHKIAQQIEKQIEQARNAVNAEFVPDESEPFDSDKNRQLAIEHRLQQEMARQRLQRLAHEKRSFQIQREYNQILEQRKNLQLNEKEKLAVKLGAGQQAEFGKKNVEFFKSLGLVKEKLNKSSGDSSSEGTFSASAVRGLAGRSPLNRIAESTQATANNTKKILAQQKKNGNQGIKFT